MSDSLSGKCKYFFFICRLSIQNGGKGSVTQKIAGLFAQLADGYNSIERKGMGTFVKHRMTALADGYDSIERKGVETLVKHRMTACCRKLLFVYVCGYYLLKPAIQTITVYKTNTERVMNPLC